MGNVSATKMAVVIPAYRRADSLAAVLRQLRPSRVSKVYIAIDGARPGAESDVQTTTMVAREFGEGSSIETLIRTRGSNVGTAVNVLGAIDWMFAHEPIGAILEDDCVPSEDFFDFAYAALLEYADNPRVWMASGSQLAPASLIEGTHVLCPYGLIWGWATTQGRWRAMFRDLKRSLEFGLVPDTTGGSTLRRSDAAYWKSGHLRAARGFVDSWAMPITAVAIFSGRVGVLPPHNLVTNVGNDARATRTRNDTRWTHRAAGGPVRLPLGPSLDQDNEQVTEWLRRHLFRIGPRHRVSTQWTSAIDAFRREAQLNPLLMRLSAA